VQGNFTFLCSKNLPGVHQYVYFSVTHACGNACAIFCFSFIFSVFLPVMNELFVGAKAVHCILHHVKEILWE